MRPGFSLVATTVAAWGLAVAGCSRSTVAPHPAAPAPGAHTPPPAAATHAPPPAVATHAPPPAAASPQVAAVPAQAPAPPADSKPATKSHSAVPAEKLGTMPPGVGLPVGARLPKAQVADAEGKPVQIQSLAKGGAVLVVFYRGGWCPYCNYQVRSLAAASDQFRARGVTPVLVSVDIADQAARTQATWTIPFPVLSDPDLAAHKAFNVIHQAGDAEVERLRSYGMILSDYSRRDHQSFAVPAIFLADKRGVIRWAHADRDYKVRPTVEQLVGVLDELGFAPR